jgi:predicted O-methyltransferase YrrM
MRMRRKTQRKTCRANVPPKIEVITGNAIQVIPQLNNFFDFVLIDAEKKKYMDYRG